ncbi:MAG: peptidyl-prolyl cis-trans isomerase, partial [Candidatus Omnitrophica bacterium]|nr:peptidyl-prolyl cis-trans isomerase [Candidatus Omnitrophota bacterium]
LLTEILNGADFAMKAKENSKGPTAAAGGDLGFLTEDPFPEMVEAILSLGEGEVSNVIKGPDGFYIVKLTEKTGGRPIPYEEVKEEIFQDRLLFKQQQAILDHLEKLEAEFSVQINEELLQ